MAQLTVCTNAGFIFLCINFSLVGTDVCECVNNFISITGVKRTKGHVPHTGSRSASTETGFSVQVHHKSGQATRVCSHNIPAPSLVHKQNLHYVTLADQCTHVSLKLLYQTGVYPSGAQVCNGVFCTFNAYF